MKMMTLFLSFFQLLTILPCAELIAALINKLLTYKIILKFEIENFFLGFWTLYYCCFQTKPKYL